ncbi:hypothetical protein ZWY2020_035672 [Hordeum vulgare]|nr:hypothetical protein ZWY2020_035672 [Hordeum vulgare]
MEAYVDEVRKIEERFDGLQTQHVPRAENSGADDLSKRVALKLPVEPRTFVLCLTQPSLVPLARPDKRKKFKSRQYFPAELRKAADKHLVRKEVAGDNTKSPGEQEVVAGPRVLVVVINAPAAEDMPLVVAVEPQAPTWAQHIVWFLQIGELPEEQEEAEKVARQSNMYQFVGNMMYRKRPNGVKLKCIPREDGRELLADIHESICGSHIGWRALVGKALRQGFFCPLPSKMQRH